MRYNLSINFTKAANTDPGVLLGERSMYRLVLSLFIATLFLFIPISSVHALCYGFSCQNLNESHLIYDCDGNGVTDDACYDNQNNRQVCLYFPGATSDTYLSGVWAPVSSCPGIFEWHKITRWWQPSDKDWVDIQDFSMVSNYGYETPIAMYSLKRVAGSTWTIMVNRWWNAGDGDWVTIPESGDGHIPDITLVSWGYTSKSPLGYASTVAFIGSTQVSRWWHAGDKDWVTIPDFGPGSIADSTMLAIGYVSKVTMFHARL